MPNLTASQRALQHPLWWGALGVLLLNDHALKGSGMLPGAVTGKLSDFAGLIVAPVLLAALLGARKRWQLAACVTAVLLGFSAIQFSAAARWPLEALLGWHITPDPTDLIAAAVLPIAWAILHRPPAAARRAVVHVGAAAGLLVCAASSEPDWSEETLGEVSPAWAQLFLHNTHDADIFVDVRLLRAEVEFDCKVIAADPGGLLISELFGTTEQWQVPPQHNLPLSGLSGGCSAALVSVEGREEAVLFWQGLDGQELAWQTETYEDYTQPLGIGLLFDGGEFLGYDDQDTDTVHALWGSEETCPRGVTLNPLVWSEPLPDGEQLITERFDGVDGCTELTFEGGEHWFVCAPADLLSFQAGDLLTVTTPPSGLTLHSGDTQSTLVQRSDGLFASGVQTAEVHPDECGLWVDRSCGAVGQDASITVTSGEEEGHIQVGETLTFSTDSQTTSVTLLRGEIRLAEDTTCDELGSPFEGIVTIKEEK